LPRELLASTEVSIVRLDYHPWRFCRCMPKSRW